MTSIVDSEAQFDIRLEQVRVPIALRQALKNSDVSTISALAYAHGQPFFPVRRLHGFRQVVPQVCTVLAGNEL